jgi:hypothetical protein
MAGGEPLDDELRALAVERLGSPLHEMNIFTPEERKTLVDHDWLFTPGERLNQR